MRVVSRVLMATGAIGASILLYALAFAPPAGAQLLGQCSAAINGQPYQLFNTPKNAYQVRSDQTLQIIGTVPATFLSSSGSNVIYLVKLELMGASWTAASGTGTGNSWEGVVNVKTYATRGKGIYKVIAVSQGSSGNCSGRAYIEVVDDGGPLGTTSGQAAAGAAVLGAAGVAVASATGKKEITEGLVGEKVVEFLENQGKPPETTEAADTAAAQAELTAKHGHELTLMEFCLPLVVVAAAATIRAMAADMGRHVVAAIGGWMR